MTENASHGVIISLVGYLLFAALHNAWGFYGAAFIVGLGNGHMFPAFQTMFIGMAPACRRGTANSTLYTAWETGVGLGIVLGGIVAEHCSYSAAFWMSGLFNLAGVVLYFAYARRHFLRNRLT